MQKELKNEDDANMPLFCQEHKAEGYSLYNKGGYDLLREKKCR